LRVVTEGYWLALSSERRQCGKSGISFCATRELATLRHVR
jgi:hypothetical protein